MKILRESHLLGRAGKLLDKMLASIQLDRTKVYISNVVNYRPPSNRRPTEIEIERYLSLFNKVILKLLIQKYYYYLGQHSFKHINWK